MMGKWNLLQKLGLLLVILSCVLLLGSELFAMHNSTSAQNLAEKLKAVLPERTEGNPENYSETVMPILQLKKQDFSGLLEIPDYGVSLPVGSSWNRTMVFRYPCRFWGSAYDQSLIIGGSGRKGQLDVCGKLDLGDRILLTDVAGARFSYEVNRIDRRKHADMDTFGEYDSDLVLFAEDSASSGYIIVRCQFSPRA